MRKSSPTSRWAASRVRSHHDAWLRRHVAWRSWRCRRTGLAPAMTALAAANCFAAIVPGPADDLRRPCRPHRRPGARPAFLRHRRPAAEPERHPRAYPAAAGPAGAGLAVRGAVPSGDRLGGAERRRLQPYRRPRRQRRYRLRPDPGLAVPRRQHRRHPAGHPPHQEPPPVPVRRPRRRPAAPGRGDPRRPAPAGRRWRRRPVVRGRPCAAPASCPSSAWKTCWPRPRPCRAPSPSAATPWRSSAMPSARPVSPPTACCGRACTCGRTTSDHGILHVASADLAATAFALAARPDIGGVLVVHAPLGPATRRRSPACASRRATCARRCWSARWAKPPARCIAPRWRAPACRCSPRRTRRSRASSTWCATAATARRRANCRPARCWTSRPNVTGCAAVSTGCAPPAGWRSRRTRRWTSWRAYGIPTVPTRFAASAQDAADAAGAAWAFRRW